MPLNNCFQHQLYPTEPSTLPVLRTLECTDGATGEFAALHTSLRVGRVVLVHGTFMGDDPLGFAEMLKSVGQGVPLLRATMEALAQRLVERTRLTSSSLAGDLGNFTPAFRDKFQSLVGDDPRVELLEPTWSSQNHHLARADLAVRLLDQLLRRPLPGDQRILLWGHSHAGNAFALLTNLLANDKATVAKFFDAAGDQPGAHWKAVRESLQSASSPHPLAKSVLIAEFETPVRYGWDTAGHAGLVHVTFHRPFDLSQPFRAKPMFPPHPLNDVMNATWGDWVQAFAIAGTDVSSMPSISVNQRLSALLEANLPEPEHGFDTRLISPRQVRDVCGRWKTGTRCHADGLNVLVDYKPSGELTAIGRPIELSLLGHGVATTVKWLPAHLKLVLEQLSRTPVS